MLEPEPQKSQRQPMHHGHLPVPPAPGAAWLCWAPVSHRVLRPRWWEGWRDGLRALCVCLPDFTTPLRPSFLTSFTNSSLQTFLPRWGCCQDYRALLLITTYFTLRLTVYFFFFFLNVISLEQKPCCQDKRKCPPDPELVGAAGAAPPVQLRLCRLPLRPWPAHSVVPAVSPHPAASSPMAPTSSHSPGDLRVLSSLTTFTNTF